MKTTKHTPTPWKLSYQDGDYFEDKPKTCIFADTKPFQTIVAFDIGSIQQTKEQREQDAAHIVKCVNMHDEMVLFLNNFIQGYISDEAMMPEAKRLLKIASE